MKKQFKIIYKTTGRQMERERERIGEGERQNEGKERGKDRESAKGSLKPGPYIGLGEFRRSAFAPQKSHFPPRQKGIINLFYIAPKGNAKWKIL